MRIGIILDNPRRDLLGILLLAYQLVKSGNEVFIIPMYQQGYDIPLLKLDIVVVNYARLNNLTLLRSYKKIGIRTVIMDTEGGVLSQDGIDSPENWSKHIFESGIYKSIDDYCFWGEKVYSTFLRTSGINKNNLHLTGCPRFDLCNKKWRGLLPDNDDKYVLVNTNFSSVNPLLTRSPEDELNAFLSAGWEEIYITKVIDEFKKLLPIYVDSIKELALQKKHLKFRVRPHPFESPDIYLSSFIGIKNIEVCSDGNIVDVINNALCVLHLNCGSSIEAFMLEKLPVSMEYLNNDFMRRHTPLPSKISCCVNSINELDDLLDNLGVSKTYMSQSKYSEHIEPWFYKNDGSAAKRLANILVRLNSDKSSGSKINIFQSIKGSHEKPRTMQLIQGIVVNLMGSRLVSLFRRKMKKETNVKYSNINDVAGLLKKINLIDGGGCDVVSKHARHPYTKMRLSSISIKIVT